MSQMSPDQQGRVTLALDGHVAEVRLSRPDKHNALDERMFEALSAAGTDLTTRPDVRAVVLSGEGPSFCAGLDLAHFGPKIAEGVFDDLGERSHGDANLFQHVALVWRDLQVPVIAALQGSVFGGGLQIGGAALHVRGGLGHLVKPGCAAPRGAVQRSGHQGRNRPA